MATATSTASDRIRSTGQATLRVQNLSVSFVSKRAPEKRVLRDVCLTIEPGQFVGLLGESGSGKSTLGNAILNLPSGSATIMGGSIRFAGKDITKLSEREFRAYRWRDISTVFQSSMASLNPIMTVRAQLLDIFAAHPDAFTNAPGHIESRISEVLSLVSIDEKFLVSYPHQLSGGMKQRIAFAMALLLDPDLIIFDEPTTGLDVIVQHSILTKLRDLQRTMGFAVLFISHDLGTVMNMADRVLVMYAGEIVEDSPAEAILSGVAHPYTVGLLSSYADPRQEQVAVRFIAGRPPQLDAKSTGCAFAPRCVLATATCHEPVPPRVLGDRTIACTLFGDTAQPTLEQLEQVGETVDVTSRDITGSDTVCTISNLSKKYVTRKGMKRIVVQAVDDVSLTLRAGGVTALVGQSGSGKTTIGRILTGIERPTSGRVQVGDLKVETLGRKGLRDLRRSVQYIFQDPFQALNPTSTVEYAVSRPLSNYQALRGAALSAAIDTMLEQVGLTPASDYRQRLPHELSGGQRQRVVIARALAANPTVIVADEPISMLDVSIRAEILQVLMRLTRDHGIATLYITHDLLSARLIADHIIVLSDGRIVDEGDTMRVIRDSQDPYTQRLIEAIPNPFARTGNVT